MASPRKIIDVIDRKHMPERIGRPSPIARHAEMILNIAVAAAVRVPGIREVAGVGIGSTEGQSSAEALFQMHLQRFVFRITRVRPVSDVHEVRVDEKLWPPRALRSRTGQGLIQIYTVTQNPLATS